MTLHEDFADALTKSGANVVSVNPKSGKRSAPNPTDVTVKIGRNLQTYTVFAWNITHEGKGRSGDNWRVQATSFGKKNSPVDIGPLTVGLGWHETYGVWVAFDPWVKRSPGTSSSVHITDELLKTGAATGKIATTHRDHLWDPRLAFTPTHADTIFEWMNKLWTPKSTDLEVLHYRYVDETGQDVLNKTGTNVIVAEVDPTDSPAAAGVRENDRVAIYKDSVRANDYYWRVSQIHIEDMSYQTPNGRNRNKIHYKLTADKSARIT